MILYVVLQEELKMDLDFFTETYGTEPNKDDLTVLAPKQDDPTDQVTGRHLRLSCRAFEHPLLISRIKLEDLPIVLLYLFA
jgi:hypothetical protein